MTRLVLERFRNASRRVPSTDDDLVFDVFVRRDLVRRLPQALGSWFSVSMPHRERWHLLRACLRTRGAGSAPLAALMLAPDLYRRARAGTIDGVACFSVKGFELATALAERAGLPCTEILDKGTQYFGEFAFELLAVVPYAYWLHRQGLLRSTVSTQDTRCLYYFSPNHREENVARRYVPITEYPAGQTARVRLDVSGFPEHLSTEKWAPPPYRQVYANSDFHWPRETCVVLNKTSPERYLSDGAPVNFIESGLLLEAIGRLRARYQVVYDRPRDSDITNDRERPRELGDIEAVKSAYPDVLTIQELAARHPELSFNELQLRLFANCSKFVSVLGGGSYLASYFGGTNVVYARRGWEVSCGAYERWFHLFSGARVVRAASPPDLLSTIDRELLRASD